MLRALMKVKVLIQNTKLLCTHELTCGHVPSSFCFSNTKMTVSVALYATIVIHIIIPTKFSHLIFKQARCLKGFTAIRKQPKSTVYIAVGPAIHFSRYLKLLFSALQQSGCKKNIMATCVYTCNKQYNNTYINHIPL